MELYADLQQIVIYKIYKDQYLIFVNGSEPIVCESKKYMLSRLAAEKKKLGITQKIKNQRSKKRKIIN